MVLKLFPRWEFSLAKLAVDIRLVQSLDVTLEGRFSRKLLKAEFTAINFRVRRLHARVEPHVTVENDFADETFVAFRTFVGLVARVGRHVKLQPALRRDLPVADGANPVDARVDLHVALKNRLRHQLLAEPAGNHLGIVGMLVLAGVRFVLIVIGEAQVAELAVTQVRQPIVAVRSFALPLLVARVVADAFVGEKLLAAVLADEAGGAGVEAHVARQGMEGNEVFAA